MVTRDTGIDQQGGQCSDEYVEQLWASIHEVHTRDGRMLKDGVKGQWCGYGEPNWSGRHLK